MSNTGEDEAGVIRARVKAHIVFLAVRNAAEDQTTDTEEQCLPRGVDVIVLRHLPLNKSKIQSGGSSSRSHTLLFRPE